MRELYQKLTNKLERYEEAQANALEDQTSKNLIKYYQAKGALETFLRRSSGRLLEIMEEVMDESIEQEPTNEDQSDSG